MPRTANLTLDGKSFETAFVKLDRKKVYGWSKIDIYDKDSKSCSLASIADGEHILPSGSVTLAGFNSKGEYVKKSNLIGIDREGNKVDKIPSIYDKSANLTKVTLDEFLSINVKSVYQLSISESKDDLLSLLNSGDIYHFPFNYRADYNADDGYLITNENEVFAVIGEKANIEFIGLENKEEEVPEAVEEESGEIDDFDFGML